MNKEIKSHKEAELALREGKKLVNIYYSEGEYLFLNLAQGQLQTEEGCLHGNFNDEFWPLINRTSIEDVIKRDLNSLPFIKNDTSYLYDSIDYFREQEICSNPNPNDPGCIFCLYIRFAKGEIPYKKEKKYDVIFLEGDCETFLKGKPTFLKEIK